MPYKRYTTKEVAKIIHVSVETVRKMVYRKELGCFGSSNPRGSGHRIRIGRDHIKIYMMRHSEKFTDSELMEWGAAPDPYGSQYEAHLEREICEHDGGLSNYTDVQGERNCPSMPDPDVKPKAYLLHLNERIAVGNITAETTMKIVEAILRDPVCDVTSFKIERMV